MTTPPFTYTAPPDTDFEFWPVKIALAHPLDPFFSGYQIESISLCLLKVRDEAIDLEKYQSRVQARKMAEKL